MTQVARFAVVPYYGQIYVEDPGTSDLPEFETGEELCVWTERAVVIATQSDDVGDVAVEVWSGDQADDDSWNSVGEGELVLSGTNLEIGSIVGEDLHVVDIGRTGSVSLRILTAGELGAPDRVRVVVVP